MMKNFKKIVNAFSFFLFLSFLKVGSLFAQVGGGGGGARAAGSPPRLEGIFPVIYNALTFIFSFFAIITAGMVVYGAYMWMASAGDPQKTKQAQGVLTWAVIGLIFFITFGFFADFFLDLLGIELPTPTQEVFDF